MTKYEIIIGGYGCEVCWSKLTEKQYQFWSSCDKKYLDRHVLGSNPFDSDSDENSDGDEENNNHGRVSETKEFFNNMPEYADLRENDTREWYDMDDIDREYYCTLDSAWLCVNKLRETHDSDGNEISSADRSDNEQVVYFSNIMDNVRENSNCENLIVHNNSESYISHPHVLQVMSYEKGTFFTGTIELFDNNGNSSDDLFDIKRLRIHVSEALNESDTRIDSVEYDGYDLDNYGAETRGKGVDVFLVEF